MRYLKLLLGALLILGFIGCEDISQIFEFNLVEGLEYVPVPTAAELGSMETGEALQSLDQEFESDTFFDRLSTPEAQAQKDELSTYLTDVRTSETATTEQKQQAQILYADLHMKTTGGDEFVNNVTAVADDLVSGEMFQSSDPGAEIQTLFTDLIPLDIQETTDPEVKKEQISAMLNGLIEADTAYQEFGDTLAASEAPEDTNMGAVAQNALVSFIVAGVADGMLTEEEKADPGAAMYDLLYPAEGGESIVDRADTFDTTALDFTAGSTSAILDEAGLSFGDTGTTDGTQQ